MTLTNSIAIVWNLITALGEAKQSILQSTAEVCSPVTGMLIASGSEPIEGVVGWECFKQGSRGEMKHLLLKA